MINDLFFPYHMAIALHPNMGETQLDAATVYYRLVTRFKRYLVSKLDYKHIFALSFRPIRRTLSSEMK
jgi:hypothetical protein